LIRVKLGYKMSVYKSFDDEEALKAEEVAPFVEENSQNEARSYKSRVIGSVVLYAAVVATTLAVSFSRGSHNAVNTNSAGPGAASFSVKASDFAQLNQLAQQQLEEALSAKATTETTTTTAESSTSTVSSSSSSSVKASKRGAIYGKDYLKSSKMTMEDSEGPAPPSPEIATFPPSVAPIPPGKSNASDWT
jgi:hypothetical protein